MFLQYLIELMFLELDVSGCIGLISSFDRSGTTVFSYSSLRASLLTVLRVCICHCSAYFFIPNVSQTSYSCVNPFPSSTFRPQLLIFSISHENEVNPF